ncbi:Alpha-tocopherol transfer protein-like [Pseudolycoriella hygida]|uniref:Alpha-tocopherol transfer protein-like n=1 Tax=Pseudolycoriella hygida TaxID=35572 RepID=A0A9Q0MZR5_9DIPT|nr:Alpha-tocopherol transfer protein-like [Pseudolycoriella hygida]
MTEVLFKKHEKQLKEFKEWLNLKPHLPAIDTLMLLRFLKVNNFDLKMAKELLLLNLDMRKNNPTIFANRDVTNVSFQQAFNTLQVFPMPTNTPENHKISISRLVDTNPDNYVCLDVVRAVVAMLDVRFVTVDSNELIDGEIGVIDMNGFGWKHIMKTASNLTITKKYMAYVQEAAPFKVIQNHFVNYSPTMERFIAFLKPFLKKEILDSIKFHSSTETLYEYLPRHLLPNEYGGTAGKCDDHHNNWLNIVRSRREYILNDNNWMIAKT